MHYYLLVQLSCSLLLLVADGVELPEEDGLFTEFPGGLNLPEMGEPSEQEQDVIQAQRINWHVIDNFDRQERHVQPTESSLEAEEEEVEPTEPAEGVKELESLARDGSDCPITSDRGLNGLIRNARPLFPLERLRNILANAREDPEVRYLLQLLHNEPFQERVRRLQATKEKLALKSYLCQSLKLDQAYYLEYLRVLFNAQLAEPPSSPLPNRRQGIRGLLQDLRDALPRSDLRDLYRRQLASDRQLSAAVRRIRGSEFRRLLASLRALPEYAAVRDALQKAGVPFQQLQSLMTNALGSSTLDLGAEIELLSG